MPTTARPDPAAALRAHADKWERIARHHRARGERVLAARAERMADGYRAALCVPFSTSTTAAA